MATLQAFKRKVHPSTVLLCVSNTYRPELNNQKRTIIKTGPSVFDWVGAGDTRKSRSSWPLARDVVLVSENELTFRMFPDDPQRNHTVTLRIISAGD